jgi:lipopolysaccharide/colanic/teichoic acid biosynthesis glycosyltransferase
LRKLAWQLEGTGIDLVVGIALAIKLTDRGPVLFRQTRIGHQGMIPE